MTEILLNAVLNLFAIQASMLGAQFRPQVRAVLELYLRQHLRLSGYTEYLELYDVALDLHDDSDDKTRLEHARGVAAGLKSMLPRFEQFVFVLRYLEAVTQLDQDAAAMAVAEVVSGELAISSQQVEEMRTLCQTPFEKDRLTQNFLLSTTGVDAPQTVPDQALWLTRPDFVGRLSILHLADAGVCFVVVDSASPVSLDSIQIPPNSPHLLQPGGILRDQHGTSIYYAEIDAALRNDRKHGQGLSFTGTNLEFRYPNSESGLHNFSFTQQGGSMVAVMGVSGAGKSTLLNILNGQCPPDSGQVLVNGIDLHSEADKLEGVIGYVPQDDLLFEDLTVFDNLYYSASLCLANMDKAARQERVVELLDELHQLPTRDLKVGSPLDKTISGGQRKRLNIALELIREPSILFVDEPTSGLSSSDSENVMALLKAQAAKGKLVIVVIHQPSSRIYKMFDTLWIMDQGGRPIYDGNPLDAIVHFRSEVHQAGMDEYACPHCGHVNPEQLFEIIETKSVDENGQYGRERFFSPAHWHERYLEHRQNVTPPPTSDATQQATSAPIERRLWRPDWLGQLSIFFMRNLKGRLANGQYMLVNLLEPPLLALLAALISHGAWGGEYTFKDNGNLGTYFFISVIVALFLGMSVSAEEINRDQKILKREQFLHLSWPCYIASKALYLFMVVAVQMAFFTLIGNFILKIPDMYGATWLVLFVSAAASCLLGLNISATFKSAVTIYILIPLLLVPQMMLGGAVVPFDDLLSKDAGNRHTPLVANIMPSRWGYEALIVDQYLSNAYMRHLLPAQLTEKQNSYLVNSYLPAVRALADFPLLEGEGEKWKAEVATKIATLANEIRTIEQMTGIQAEMDLTRLQADRYGPEDRTEVKHYLKQAAEVLYDRRQAAAEEVETTEDHLRQELGAEGLDKLKQDNFNQDISNTVLNVLGMETARLSGNQLVQMAAPIAQEPDSPWGVAHFLAASKRLGQVTIDTYWFNLGVLWLMGLVLYAALFFRLLPRSLQLALTAITRLFR
ncbi:MAG: ATP-binding cassette domain-containing protein [Proteobacteria bacterium]|nr:ATP-binding cassette domain-containing protein [Pseudomonadota bacterium]